jgi:hypothetical protein
LIAPALLVALALILTATIPHSPDAPSKVDPPAHAGIPGDLDVNLYRDVVKRVAGGQDYWSAAFAEHRRHAFPTFPAITVREPAMTWLLVALGTPAIARIALGALACLASVLTWTALRRAPISSAERIAASALQLISFACLASPRAIYIHEMWAGVLIVLALALWRLDALWPAILAGIAASLIRELALPFLAAMAYCAGVESRWREVMAWMLAIGLCLALLAAHLCEVRQYQTATDLASPGWVYVGGWRFAVGAAKWSYFIGMLPQWGNTALVFLSLIGLSTAADGLPRRGLLICVGYLAAFMVIGRPENLYWGFLIAGLLPLGVGLAPSGLARLGCCLVTVTPKKSS